MREASSAHGSSAKRGVGGGAAVSASGGAGKSSSAASFTADGFRGAFLRDSTFSDVINASISSFWINLRRVVVLVSSFDEDRPTPLSGQSNKYCLSSSSSPAKS